MMTTKWTDAQKEHLKDLIAKNPNMSVREIALKFIEEDPTRTVEAVKSKFREMQKQEKESAPVESVAEAPVPEETLKVSVEEIPQEAPEEQVQEPTLENPAIEHLTKAVVEPTPEVQAPVEEVKTEVVETVAEAPKESLLKRIINWLFK